ncbi:MAG: alpha/beta hydrolase family protein [Pseudobdellovibrionaceae bacterium]
MADMTKTHSSQTLPFLVEEPHRVTLKRGVLEDSDRDNRPVPYKLYLPEGGLAKKPLIVWSHGLGGTRDGAGFIARALAENDFAVLHIQHRGTDSILWEGKEGHPWDNIRKSHIPRSATLNRFMDVPFILDNLNKIEGSEWIDPARIGMSGHSFGALTTQVMAGQLFPDENDNLVSFKEDRFQAGMLYSFVPMGHLYKGDPTALFQSMDLPLMYMTGTKDDSPVEHFDYRARLPVWDHSGSPEKHLLILEGGDHMVYNGSRGQLEDNPLRETHEHMITALSLAYWNAKLKNDESAMAFLEKGVHAYLGDAGTFRSETA